MTKEESIHQANHLQGILEQAEKQLRAHCKATAIRFAPFKPGDIVLYKRHKNTIRCRVISSRYEPKENDFVYRLTGESKQNNIDIEVPGYSLTKTYVK